MTDEEKVEIESRVAASDEVPTPGDGEQATTENLKFRW
jgi:hypothetical protein